MKKILHLLLILSVKQLNAQISFTSIESPQSQNFNGISISGSDGGSQTWTNNSSLSGWYISPSTVRLELSPTTSLQNSGGPYIVGNSSDFSIGGRASGSVTNIYIGARFVNNTGTVIRSIKVEYYGEQASIAENGSNVNVLSFQYQKSSSAITSLTSGTWTAVSSLNFSQIYTSADSQGMGGTACTGTSNQCLGLNGNIAENRVLISANFDVTLNDGEEIMLRWYEQNDPSNDHNLQIDDVVVTPYGEVTSVVLPIQLDNFEVLCSEGNLNFNWETSNEINNDYFSIESSENGTDFNEIGKIKSQFLDGSLTKYRFEFTDKRMVKYFRLKQIDLDGKVNILKTVFSDCSDKSKLLIYPNPTHGKIVIESQERNSSISIYNMIGQALFMDLKFDFITEIDLDGYAYGSYLLVVKTKNHEVVNKILYQ
jgi:hypothetical protein